MATTATIPLAPGAAPPAPLSARPVERDESVHARLSALEARWEEKIPELATKSDLHALEARIEKSHSSTIRWVIGTGIALFLGLMNADKFTGGNRQFITAPAPSQNATP